MDNKIKNAESKTSSEIAKSRRLAQVPEQASRYPRRLDLRYHSHGHP